MRETKNAYRILVGKSVGKLLLERLRSKWNDNAEMEFKI
jgi:hypothetical protein